MAMLATGVAIYSLRYGGVLFHHVAGIDPKILAVINHAPVQALIHMLIAPMALFLGPFQFFSRLRTQYTQIHRQLGFAYVVACVVAGLGALATAPFASGGPIAGIGFGVLAVLWVTTTLWAWFLALERRFEQHRLFMRYSYALTFAAVTLRLQIPVGLALGGKSYSAMSVWLAYTSWIPNALIVWACSRWLGGRSSQLILGGRGDGRGLPDKVRGRVTRLLSIAAVNKSRRRTAAE